MARVDHNFSAKERDVRALVVEQLQSGPRPRTRFPGLGGDHRDGGKYSNGGVVDSVTTINSSTLLNMRASLSYWTELIGPSDFGFDATQWGWPASRGQPTDQAHPAAEHFDCGRDDAGQRVLEHHVRADHGAQPAAERRDGPRQADHQGGTRLPADAVHAIPAQRGPRDR